MIDTDPGIDDALAILFAVASDSFDIEGLKKVSGKVPVETATQNASWLLGRLADSHKFTDRTSRWYASP
ncbi:nucleoside hydrolase [Loktanella sp. IMCC34160]|nr:nucleoside hydrolase [Loktanella sp. IMCC34160]